MMIEGRAKSGSGIEPLTGISRLFAAGETIALSCRLLARNWLFQQAAG